MFSLYDSKSCDVIFRMLADNRLFFVGVLRKPLEMADYVLFCPKKKISSHTFRNIGKLIVIKNKVENMKYSLLGIIDNFYFLGITIT
jgi:hypothetical protein